MPDFAASLLATFAEFRRRRVFRVAVVYLVVAWLLVQVADATFEPMGFPAWAQRLLIVLLALGFVLATTLAWIYNLTGQGIERTTPTPMPVPSPASAAVPDASVAILPFADMSDVGDQAHFCDGLAEEIITALTNVHGLRVASRTSSFRFRDGGTDARDIGRALNVAAIMEGSVRKVGDRVRVTAQLIDANDGFHLWAKNFDGRLEDIFVIQEEIARNVVRAFRITLKTGEEPDLARNAPRDMRAYDYYLRGRQLLSKKATATWMGAPELFRCAIAIDPGWALAHAGLANAIVQLMIWQVASADDVSLDEALAASRRALEIAPDLAEAHVAQANLLWLDDAHEGAQAEFEAAIALNPRLYEAHYYLARQCFARGLHRRAMQEFEAAHECRPDEFQALRMAVAAATAVGDRQRADDFARRALKAALEETEADPSNGRAHYFAGVLQLHLGDAEAGRRNVEAALRLDPHDFGTLYNASCFYALAGDAQRALDLLDEYVATGNGFRDWVAQDPDFETLRDAPRFKAILSRIRDRRSA